MGGRSGALGGGTTTLHPLDPWQVLHIIFGNCIDLFLWVFPPARHNEKVTASRGFVCLKINVGAWVGMEGCSTRWVDAAYTLKSL